MATDFATPPFSYLYDQDFSTWNQWFEYFLLWRFPNELLLLWDREPMVKFSPSKTKVGLQSSPEVAYFSSRGPSSLSPSVLKVLKSFLKRIVSHLALF